jgi:hypothetical protein
MQTPSQGHSSPLGLSAWHAARRGVGRDYSVARAWTGAVDGRGPSESAAYGEGKLGALRRSWQRWGRDWRGDRYGAGTDTARGQIRRGDRYGAGTDTAARLGDSTGEGAWKGIRQTDWGQMRRGRIRQCNGRRDCFWYSVIKGSSD